MARAGVGFSQVAEAAGALAAAGIKVTVDSVRVRLGGTGSRSTIGPLVKRWKEENEQLAARAQTGLPLELLQALERLYLDVKHRFDEELKAAQMAASERIDELENRWAIADEQLSAAKRQNETLSVEIAQRELDLRDVRDELIEERAQRGALNAAHAVLEQRVSDSASTVANLRKQIEQGRRQFDHLQNATQARLEQERKAHAAQLHDALQASASLREQLQIAQNEALTRKVKLDHVRDAHADIARQNQQLQASEAQLRNDIAGKGVALRQLHDKLAAAEAALAELQDKSGKISATLADAEKRLAVSQTRESALDMALGSERQRTHALQQDVIALSRQNARLETELGQSRPASRSGD